MKYHWILYYPDDDESKSGARSARSVSTISRRRSLQIVADHPGRAHFNTICSNAAAATCAAAPGCKYQRKYKEKYKRTVGSRAEAGAGTHCQRYENKRQ